MIRVTQNSLATQTIDAVLDRFARLAKVEKEVSTGKAITRISEDPWRGSEILDYSSELSRIEQYLRNAGTAQSELQTVEASIGQVNDLITRVRSLALQVANGTLNYSDRQSIADQIDQELNELLRIANEKSGRRHIYGGDESPYNATVGESGRVTSVAVSAFATQNPNELIVGDGVRMCVGIAADDVFSFGGDQNMFDLLISLRDSIVADEQDRVTTAVGELDEALDNIESTTTLIGSRLSAVIETQEKLETANLNATERLSELADADIIEAISRYNQEEAYYKMSLEVTARLMRVSLLDFV